MGQEQSVQTGVVVPVVGSGSALAQAAEAAAAEDVALLDATNGIAVPPATLGVSGDADEASQLLSALNALVVAPGGGECAGLDALDGGVRARGVAAAQRRLAALVGEAARRAGVLQAAVNAARVAAPGVARVADTVDRLAMDVADACEAFGEAADAADTLAARHFEEGHELASFANYLRAHPIGVDVVETKAASDTQS